MDCTIIGEKVFKNVEFETQRGAENELPFFLRLREKNTSIWSKKQRKGILYAEHFKHYLMLRSINV